MTEFGNTNRGAKFYDADVPRIADALERIAAGLEKQPSSVDLKESMAHARSLCTDENAHRRCATQHPRHESIICSLLVDHPTDHSTLGIVPVQWAASTGVDEQPRCHRQDPTNGARNCLLAEEHRGFHDSSGGGSGGHKWATMDTKRPDKCAVMNPRVGGIKCGLDEGHVGDHIADGSDPFVWADDIEKVCWAKHPTRSLVKCDYELGHAEGHHGYLPDGVGEVRWTLEGEEKPTEKAIEKTCGSVYSRVPRIVCSLANGHDGLHDAGTHSWGALQLEELKDGELVRKLDDDEACKECDAENALSTVEVAHTIDPHVHECQQSKPGSVPDRTPHAPSERTSHFAHARGVMRRELQANEDIMEAYRANVAMLLYDEYNNIDFGAHSTRNKAAEEILELIFGFNE